MNLALRILRSSSSFILLSIDENVFKHLLSNIFDIHIKKLGGAKMEETLFLKFLGRDNPIIRVIDFLIDNEAFSKLAELLCLRSGKLSKILE